jgi:type I restriction enzyme S subunit
MNKNNKHTLVPKLHFPEFQNEGEWEVKKLGEITEFVRNGLNINQTNEKEGYKVTRIETISEGRINIEKVGYIRTLQDIAEYKLLIGDMLFSNINSVAHIGKIAFIDKDYDLYHGMNLLNIRINQDEHCPKFYFYQLTNCRLKRYFEEICNKAVNQASINQTDLKKTELAFPSLPEQQKIAACLSSIDEVIRAESQKLELYQQHKKGLLQNLFPQEGETVPKLRFKDFEESGEWEESTLTQVADYENGKAHEQDIADDGEFIVVNSKFISQDGKVKKFTNTAFSLANKGDVLMVLSDVPNGKAIAKCFLVEEDNRYIVNQRICRITPRNLNSKILYYLLNRNPYFLSFDDGVKQTNLRKEDVLNCPLFIPSDPKEQEKIADTLSSIDDLISAQSQKIVMLQQHKKGLLQGLFPPINN